MTKAMSPNSLANLMPAWEAGPSGGRPPVTRNHGAAIIEWLNTMGSWPTDRIQGVAEDASAPTNKRLAAKSIVRSMSDEWAKNGKPHAIEDLNLGMDRCDGKPVQRVDVVRTEVRDPGELRVRLVEALAAAPGLAESLGLGALVAGEGVLPKGAGAPNPGEGDG